MKVLPRYCYLIFFFFPITSFSQINLDSLAIEKQISMLKDFLAVGEIKSVLHLSDSIQSNLISEKNAQWARVKSFRATALSYSRKFKEASQELTDAKNFWIEKRDTLNEFYGDIYLATGVRDYFMGNMEAAIVNTKRANKRYEVSIGKNNIKYAEASINLAAFYQQTTRYEKAEAIYLESIPIIKKQYGTEHIMHAICLNNLGNLYEQMGAYDKAQPLMIQSIDIRKKIVGENHPSYATAINNLAIVYERLGKYD